MALALVFAFLCAPPPAEAASALADLIASLETSEHSDPEKVAAVYRETVLSGDGIDRAVARLSAYARGATLSPEAQAACHLAIAHLQWRDGAIEDAVVSSDQALESAPTPETLLLKARLLDAGGEEDRARDWYLRASEAFGEGDEQWLIRVRLAMMDVSSRNVEVLEELASQRDQDFRNQAAVVLALLGRPDRAIALYKPLPEAGKLFQQHVRLSDWALKAESHDLAREQAWQGYATAQVRADRLYALSLLAESYRSADELDLLLEDLASRDAEDQELLRLRVETLIETEEYHQAIELYEQLEGSEADIAERRRLVALFEAAGDTDAMVREYRRMMDSEPDQVQWYDGLAAHYLNLADNDAALAVWETLEERNAESAGVLVEGARLMVQMGFVHESVAMVERHLEGHGPDVGALLFLFETWLNRGQDGPALDALVRLEELLPPDAAELVDLADAYERLSRPEEALRVFEAIRDTRGELGYDDQMRLAWLYTLVNRKDEALDLWRDIWLGVESPARRSFAESQLLLLAAELGALGDMAVELEGMLIGGTANRNHMNLLVRIYTESGDKLSATEIIDEYAQEMGEDAVGHQALLAHVYMLLEDYPAHDKALRRLYEIDPDNRIDHIKSIIINLLTFDLATQSNERFEEIRHWIAELRKFDEESVTGEFEASIFSMAGFSEQAIEAYRRALVEQPENSDNLLLLADVMDGDARTGEAVAILQFFAENAVEDNDFVVAVDGILNLIGTTTFFQQPDPEAQDTLDWTRRVILERIAGRANKFYLYELLADIAREKGDTETSFVALENSLAEAGLRRPAVLRELLTLSTPNAGFSGFSTGSGDIDRQLKFGRRLVGLRQVLPPEVYIDVGKSLLAREDVSGAERAFEMIDDITGMIDIDRTKAEIFEQAGYDEQSRVFYNRALNVNRDSLDLLHKTGYLYEAIGRDDVAFKRYLQAISDVLRRQSTVLAAGARPVDPNSWQAMMNQRTDTTVTREFREHYASLEQGLMLSWPKDPEASAAAAAELKALFEVEMRNVLDRTDEEFLPLARYARLDRTARLIRHVGFFLGDQDLARYADRKLLDHFGADEAFAEHLVEAYAAAGRTLPEGVTVADDASALAALSPLRRQLELARDREDFETQLQLLRLAGAFDEMETLLGERILDGKFRDGLGYALGLLGKAEFKRLALATSSKLLEERDALLALVGSDVDMLLKAEELAGQALVPPREVIALLLNPDAGNQSPNPFGSNDTSGHWRYLEERGSTDDRIRYFKAEVERSQSSGGMFRNFGSTGSFRALLKEKLSAEQRKEVTDTVKDYLAKLETNDDSALYTIPQVLLVLDAQARNTEVLYRIADYVENRWPNFPSARPLLEALYAGQFDEAFRLIVEIEDNMPEQQGFAMRLFVPGLDDALADPQSRLLDQIAAGEPVDLDLARAAYEREFSPRFFYRRSTPERLERQVLVLEKLIVLDPDPARYEGDRIHVWLSLGYTDRAGAAIAEKYQVASENASWRLAYFLYLRSQQRFEEGLAVATDGGPDFSDPAVLQQATTRQARGFSGPVASIIRQLQSSQSFGVAVGSVAGPSGLMSLGAPRSQGRRQGPVQRLNEALHGDDHELGRQALREAWRSLSAPRNSPYGRPPGSMPLTYLAQNLLNTPMQAPGQNASRLPRAASFGGMAILLSPAAMPVAAASGALGEEAPDPRMLFDAVAEAPYGAGEMDGFLRTTPDRQRKNFHQLYEYLAKAAEGGERLQELWKRLRAGQITDHEFTLWMLLRDRQRVEFGPGGLQMFEERLAALSDPSPYQLLLAARLFATAGAVEQAVAHYKLVAARRIQHNEYSDRQRAFFFEPAGPSLANLLELIDEAARRLPSEAAREVVDAVLLLARRAEDFPGIDIMFDAFLLASLEKVYTPEELFVEARRRSGGVLDLPDQLFEAGASKAAELARAYARSGDLDRATEILGAMLMEPGPEALSQEELQDQQRFMRTRTASSLSLLYGLPAVSQPYQYLQQGFTAAQEILKRLERLFPADPDDWPGASEWTGAATDALLGWLAAGQPDQDEALRLLVPLGMRQVGAGEPGQGGDVLTRILESVEAGGRPLSAESLVKLASMAQASESSLPFELVAGILEEGRLPWQQQLTLLSLYQDSDDGERLLELVRASGRDRGLGVMRVLHSIAEQSQDTAYANDLQERIEREEVAEKAMLPDEEEAVQTTAMVTP